MHPSFVTSRSDGKTYTADINGNTQNGDGRSFAWTADNRVDSVTMGGTTTMDYDYTGRRVKKYGPLGQVLYPFAGYEIGPDGTKTKYFRAGTELVAAKQSPVVNPEKKLFYHNDHLGGVNVITDINAARVQLNEYDPWGKVSRTEGNVDPEKRFTGQILDPESGLYYYGARYYDPDLARFISPDPIVPSPGDPQSLNRYSYVLNNPVKYIDPSGYGFWSVFLRIFMIIIGGGDQGISAVDPAVANGAPSGSNNPGTGNSAGGQGGVSRDVVQGFGAPQGMALQASFHGIDPGRYSIMPEWSNPSEPVQIELRKEALTEIPGNASKTTIINPGSAPTQGPLGGQGPGTPSADWRNPPGLQRPAFDPIDALFIAGGIYQAGAKAVGAVASKGLTEIGKDVVNSFAGGQFRQVILKSDVTVARVFGGDAKAVGSWLTRASAAPTRAAAFENLRLPAGNLATNVAEITIQKGTPVLVGRVAFGNAPQYFVPREHVGNLIIKSIRPLE